MKKIFGILIILSFSFGLQAQTAFSHTASNPTGAVVNTAVDTMTYTLSKSYSHLSVQPVITKVSGTVAGTSILQLSVNGTNYVNTDTLTNTNVTINTALWTKITSARYLRILTTGSGTMSATTGAKISATQ